MSATNIGSVSLPLVAALALCVSPLFAEEVTLKASDGVKVFATFSPAKADSDRVILLFHQARSNRHEYDPISPELNKAGFDTLAIDQRSGGTMWEKENQTVAVLGKPGEYADALRDLQATVDWAVAKKYKTIVAVGSSYSASLVFVLAKDNPNTITAIACFSPGEYFKGQDDYVKNAAKAVKVSMYVTCDFLNPKEQGAVKEVLQFADAKLVTRYRPADGVHGASTLRQDKNPKGYEVNLADLKKWLTGVVGR